MILVGGGGGGGYGWDLSVKASRGLVCCSAASHWNVSLYITNPIPGYLQTHWVFFVGKHHSSQCPLLSLPRVSWKE